MFARLLLPIVVVLCAALALCASGPDTPPAEGQMIEGISAEGQFAAISAGGDHSCGLRPDGAAECWGDDYDGRASPPWGEFTVVSAGVFHSCGLRSDGTAERWGYDYDGRRSPSSR